MSSTVVEAALGLGDKLGPILFQLQANFRLDLERLERFVGMLPNDARFAIEFRHDSWLVPAVFELLRTNHIALCIPDHPKMPESFKVTSDFTYIRMHLATRGLGYGERAWSRGRSESSSGRARASTSSSTSTTT